MTTHDRQDQNIQINDQLLHTQTQQIHQQTTSRSFFHRAFSPMGPGSMRASIFTIMACAMGTGVFNFPRRVQQPDLANQVGLLMIIFYIMLGGIFSLASMYMMVSVSFDRNIKTYNQLAEFAYGKSMRILSEICIVSYPIGITICFQVIFAEFIIEIVQKFFNLKTLNQDGSMTNQGNTVRIITIACAILINFIFILKKDLSSLRYISLLGTFSTFYNIFAIVITSFTGFYYYKNNQRTQMEGIFSRNHSFSEFKLVNMQNPLNHLSAIASTIFCFVSHQLIFPVLAQVKRPSKRRFKKIIKVVHIIEIFFYILLTTFGYLVLRQNQFHINGIVIQNIPTIPFLIGKIMMAVALFFAVPLNLFPSKQMLYKLIHLQKSNKNHVILSILLGLITATIAIIFSNATAYFGLLGGTIGICMSGTIPALNYLKISQQKICSVKKMLVIVFYGLMSIIGLSGAVISVVFPQ